MIIRSGFEIPYAVYTKKNVLKRGTRLNFHTSGPDYVQCIYDKMSKDKQSLLAIDIESNLQIEVPIHSCYIIATSNEEAHPIAGTRWAWFQYGGYSPKTRLEKYTPNKRSFRTDPNFISRATYRKIDTLKDDFTVKGKKKSKKEAKAERRARARAAKENKVFVPLTAFVE